MNKHTIGTKWKDRNGRDCTVFDIYTTTSSAGCMVKEEYVSYHTFLGQRVEHIDGGVTIARGVARLQGQAA
jgi:hypothetical protein